MHVSNTFSSVALKVSKVYRLRSGRWRGGERTMRSWWLGNRVRWKKKKKKKSARMPFGFLQIHTPT